MPIITLSEPFPVSNMSHRFLVDFDACAVRFARKYILKERGEMGDMTQNPAALIGSAIHKSLEKFHDTPPALRDDRTEGTLHAALAQFWPLRADLFSSPEQEARERDAARAALTHYYDDFLDDYLQPSVDIAPKTWLSRLSASYTAYPDRVYYDEDGNLRLIDYKYQQTLSHSEETIRTDLQILTYAFAVAMQTKRVPDSIGLYFLRQRELIEYSPDREDLIRAYDWIHEQKARIEATTQFRARFNEASCRYCEFFRRCGEASAPIAAVDDLAEVLAAMDPLP